MFNSNEELRELQIEAAELAHCDPDETNWSDIFAAQEAEEIDYYMSRPIGD